MTAGRVDLFKRDPGGPFHEVSRETYAKARARGETIKASCALAGITVQTGTVFEKHESMRKRVAELRAGAETYVGVSSAYMLRQVEQIMEEARKAEQFKVALDAAQFLYKAVTENKSFGQEMARALSPDVGPQELSERLKETFAQPPLPEYVAPAAPVEIAEDEGEAAE